MLFGPTSAILLGFQDRIISGQITYGCIYAVIEREKQYVPRIKIRSLNYSLGLNPKHSDGLSISWSENLRARLSTRNLTQLFQSFSGSSTYFLSYASQLDRSKISRC